MYDTIQLHAYYLRRQDGIELYRLFGSKDGKGAITLEWSFQDATSLTSALQIIGLDLPSIGHILVLLTKQGIKTIGSIPMDDAMIQKLNAAHNS